MLADKNGTAIYIMLLLHRYVVLFCRVYTTYQQ